jgi:REP element-mobilizing transposase RayT
MPDKHNRRSIRLNGYDYAQPGAYFVTICTKGHACLFGHVVNGEMHLNEAGEISQRCWEDIPHHFPSVELDAFVIMPNHIHGVVITEFCKGEESFALTHAPATTTTPQSPSRTIGSIVRGFKIGVTKWFRANTDVYSVWLRNYYEHVVRNERELAAIREYIQGNPALWDDDENNPRHV